MLEAVVEWLSTVRRTFAEDLDGVEIDRGEYVVRRVWNWVKQQRRGALSVQALVWRVAALPAVDKRALVVALSRPKNLARASRVAGSATDYHAHPWWREFRPTAAADAVQFVKHLEHSGELDPVLRSAPAERAGSAQRRGSRSRSAPQVADVDVGDFARVRRG